jgi:hypothetical protein
MKVVALAEDPLSGVHFDGSPHRVPNELWSQAEQSMGLFRINGRAGRADHISAIFAEHVSCELVRASERSFQRSLEMTRNTIADPTSDQFEAICAMDSMALANLGNLNADLPDTGLIPQSTTQVWSPQHTRQMSALVNIPRQSRGL